jgi:hypothetical protein
MNVYGDIAGRHGPAEAMARAIHQTTPLSQGRKNMFEWTRAKLDRPDAGAVGGSYGEYRELLAALDRHELAAKDGPHAPAALKCLQKIISWSDAQLLEHPTEARNAAVRKVRAAAYAELTEVALAAFNAAQSYATAEAVLLAANACLETPPDGATADQVKQHRSAALQYKKNNNLFLNTGYRDELNFRTDKFYNTRPRMGVPADLNCGLCTAAAVITNLNGNPMTTDVLVGTMRTAPSDPTVVTALQNDKHDWKRVYQHPEIFAGLERTLTNSLADASKIEGVNDSMTQGIKKEVVDRYHRTFVGEQKIAVPVPDARRQMLDPKYDGCVFAILVVSDGHWNYAHKTEHGLEFVDYQTDRQDDIGPVAGASPQMGVKQCSLGEKQNVTFMAFR